MDAAFVLVWVPPRLSWVLARDGRELASVHGFPPGRPPLTADLARAWADDLVGRPQDWQADGSERFTTHPSTTREAAMKKSYKFTANVTDLGTGERKQVADTAHFDRPVSKADAQSAIRKGLNRQDTPGTNITITD